MTSAASFVVPKYPVIQDVTDYGCERLVVVGDVHGCIEELAELSAAVGLTDKDILVFAGDLVDRGPASAAVAEAVRNLCDSRPGTYCVLGNHEEKHVRFRHHLWLERERPGYKIPMRMHPDTVTEHARMSDELLAWMAGLPAVLRLSLGYSTSPWVVEHGVRLVTHAGLLPRHPFRQETKGLIRNRFLRSRIAEGSGDLLYSPARPNPDWSCPEDAVVWDEAWQGPRVIYGHIVHSKTTPRVVNDCYGIDTGVCFGGRLTAYVEDLRTGEVTFPSVAAKATYFKDARDE